MKRLVITQGGSILKLKAQDDLIVRIDNKIIFGCEESKFQEFKRGDILTDDDGWFWIFKEYSERGNYHYRYARWRPSDNDICFMDVYVVDPKNPRYATPEQAQMLFDAIEKKGKRWDAEKYEFVDIKYTPSVGDCVKTNYRGNVCFFEVVEKTSKYIKPNVYISSQKEITTSEFGWNLLNREIIFTKISKEELQAEFKQCGYEYNFETHKAEKLRWKPKHEESYWFVSPSGKIRRSDWFDYELDFNRFNVNNCHKTEEAAQKFMDYMKNYKSE